MAYYLLASLKVKYGQQRKFNEVMSHLKPALEREGWKLIGPGRIDHYFHDRDQRKDELVRRQWPRTCGRRVGAGF